MKSTMAVWLPGMDSNRDSRLQRPLSYHLTTGNLQARFYSLNVAFAKKLIPRIAGCGANGRPSPHHRHGIHRAALATQRHYRVHPLA